MKKILFTALFALILFGLSKNASAAVINYSSGAPLYLISANQCKSVVYSDWGACMPNFNLQVRNIISSSNLGCSWTTKQQLERIRYCDSKDYFSIN